MSEKLTQILLPPINGQKIQQLTVKHATIFIGREESHRSMSAWSRYLMVFGLLFAFWMGASMVASNLQYHTILIVVGPMTELHSNSSPIDTTTVVPKTTIAASTRPQQDHNQRQQHPHPSTTTTPPQSTTTITLLTTPTASQTTKKSTSSSKAITTRNQQSVTVIKLNVGGSKICYQCDQKHPSSGWKFWGEKITRCHGIPFEKYATKTSKAFGTSVLTCYTKFDETGTVIKRGAYGFGEAYDKAIKCGDRYHTCCDEEFCNKHTKAPCPPSPKVTPKQEVKACYECKGVDACRSGRLQGSEIRTSAVFGGKSLYCYTKFDPKTGQAIARGGFGFGDVFDKHLKCDAKDYLCCYENLCNTHTVGVCAK